MQQIQAKNSYHSYNLTKGVITMIRILLSTKLGELRWSQADLARKTGIRPTTISELYNEMADRVSLKHLDLICEALECDLSDIIVRTPNKESNLKPRTGAVRPTKN